VTRLHPRVARVIAVTWGLAGLLLAGAGVVSILLGGRWLRWEGVVALALVAVGVTLWRYEVAVDVDGIEQRRAGQHTRVMWTTVTRVEVPVGRVLAGPVRVWRQEGQDPDVLPGSWGLSRHQGMELAAAIRSAVDRHGIQVDGPEPATEEDGLRPA